MGRLLYEEVRDLEQDDGLNILRSNQKEVIGACEVDSVAESYDQLEAEQEDQH